MKLEITKISHAFTWLLTSTFYAFQMVLRIIPVLMIDVMINKAGLRASELGILAGIYYLGYCVAHIPIGLMLDRIYPGYIIAGSLLICVLGLHITSISTSTPALFIARFIIGFGSAGGILGAIKVICDFYDKNLGILLGFTVTIGICGSYYAAEPVRIMLQSLSYEQVLKGLILFGLVLAASILAFYTVSKNTKHDIKWEIALLETIKNKKIWYIGISAGLMTGPITGFADFWGIRFLTQIHHLTESEAAFCISLIFVGLGIGCPIAGYLSRYIQYSNIKIVSFVGTVMLSAFMILLGIDKLSILVIRNICFILGFLSACQILSFTTIYKIVNTKNMGSSMALLNMLIMIFGLIYHAVIGFTLETFFIALPSGDLMIYSAEEYRSAFAILLTGLGLGMFGFYTMKEEAPLGNNNKKQ